MSEAVKKGNNPTEVPRRRKTPRGKSGEVARPKVLDKFIDDDSALNRGDAANQVDDLTSAVRVKASSLIAEDSSPPESKPQKAKDSDTHAVITPTNGGGGNDGGNPPESSPESFGVSQDIEDALAELSLLKRINGIQAVELKNDLASKAKTRREIMTPLRLYGLHALQNDPRLIQLHEEADALMQEVSGSVHRTQEEYVQLVGRLSSLTQRLYSLEADAYRSWGESFKNECRLIGVENELDYLFRDGKPTVIVDIGGGNSNLLRIVSSKFREIAVIMEHATDMTRDKYERRSVNKVADEIRRRAAVHLENGTTHFGHYHLIDIAPPFCAKMLEKGMNGIPHDMCSDMRLTLEAFLDPQSFVTRGNKSTPRPILPNSADIVNSRLTFDRASDIDQFLNNVLLLARKDMSTDFVFSMSLPLSNISDNETHNENVPRMPFFDPRHSRDPRGMMMGNRKDAIVQVVTYLSMKGFRVDRIAEYPSHEVVSLHNVVEPVRVLQTEYKEFLEERAQSYRDPSSRQLCLDILNGLYDADEIICLPEEYQLIHFSGKITNPVSAEEVLDGFEDQDRAEELKQILQQLQEQM